MSLDIYFKKKSLTTGCYRIDGSNITTEEMLKAFPDYNPEYKELWWRNITHNVGKIADKVPIKSGVDPDDDVSDSSLYQILWHPSSEMFGKTSWNEVMPKDYEPFLLYAISYMQKNIDVLSQYDNENGWGTAKGLLDYIIDMHKACLEFPEVDDICISI